MGRMRIWLWTSVRHRRFTFPALVVQLRASVLPPRTDVSSAISGCMRIVLTAVGRLKQGPERELAERYRKRAADAGRKAGVSGIDVIEIRESRAGDPARRMLEESIAIANLIPEDAAVLILDGRGENLSSSAF